MPLRKDFSRNFIAEKSDLENGVYYLTITLEDTEPSVWRKLAIAGDATLTQLHDAIQTSFGWGKCHLHAFESPDGEFKASDPGFDMAEDDPNVRNEQNVELQEVLQPSAQLLYKYDFGDEWTHVIECEKVEEKPEDHQTKLLDGQRAAPPEDCGGPSGFQEFLEAINNPEDPEHNAMVKWYRTSCVNAVEPFDPERIEFDKINKLLAAWSK